MRRRYIAIGAMSAALALSQSGAAAPEGTQVIRMGKGIGKIQRGMTMQQVRRALGGPHLLVYRNHNLGARGRYLELGWERPGRTSWEPVLWQIGFRSMSRREPLRVTRILTTAPSQRTPQGLGIGSRPREIVKAFPEATCVSRATATYRFQWVVVEARNGGMTAFNLDSSLSYSDPDLHKVVAVMVQRDWFSKGPGHGECPPGWERW